MGFLSKLMKNPLAQMALPMALSWAMPAMGITSMMSGINNPMLRSAIEQGLIGGGRAMLMRDKHPGRAAMGAAFGSMPFSFMKAQEAANAFNQQYYGDVDAKDLFATQYVKPELEWSQRAMEGRPQSEWISRQIKPESWGITNPRAVQEFKKKGPMTAWDVLGGKGRNVPEMRDTRFTGDFGDPIWNEKAERFAWPDERAWDASGATIGGEMVTPEVDFYSKVGKGQKNLLGQTLTEGETYTDWMPTIGSQVAGWVGGQPTAAEKWDDAKKRRRKELAFMYGIDESLMGGEMENPYYTGEGFWKDGGIASLQMDAGGAVNGPGGPKDDVIDAKLSDGEFVMTAKAVENLGGGNRLAGAKQMYNMMNQLDPQSETVQESVIGV
jgi:hypothetical protein